MHAERSGPVLAVVYDHDHAGGQPQRIASMYFNVTANES